MTPLWLTPPGAAWRRMAPPFLQGRRGYYFWAVYLRGGCPLCCGYDCGCTKTRNFTYSCLLTKRSTTVVGPQSIVTAGNKCRNTTPISTPTGRNTQKRRKFERMLQNAGRGSYQAVRKAPQNCMNSTHKMHSGRAKKKPKTARNFVFILIFQCC